MQSIALKGSAAEVRWAYRSAASLGAWTVNGTALEAVVTAHDAYAIQKTPLEFVVRRPNGRAWSWPITGVRVDGATLYAELTPEERPA